MADIPQEVQEAAQSIEWVETLIDDQAAIQHEFYKVWLAGKRAGMERAAEIAEEDNELCNCHARSESECGCGAWWGSKQASPLAIAQAIRSENDGR